MRIALTVLAATLIWWGGQGGDTATTTDTLIALLGILSSLTLAIKADNTPKK